MSLSVTGFLGAGHTERSTLRNSWQRLLGLLLLEGLPASLTSFSGAIVVVTTIVVTGYWNARTTTVYALRHSSFVAVVTARCILLGFPWKRKQPFLECNVRLAASVIPAVSETMCVLHVQAVVFLPE